MKFKTVICVLNSKYIHSSLAPWCLYTACKKELSGEHEVKVVEGTINEKQEYIYNRIIAEKPDFVGFSCYIWNITKSLELAKKLKNQGITIALGGPEVSYRQKDILERYDFVDYVLSGEGEKIFPELVKTLAKGEMSEIKGVCLRKDGEYLISEGDAIDFENSVSPYCEEYFEALGNRIAYIESSRGCPFSCSYCLSSVDKKLRFRDLELVKKELQFFIDQKVPQIKFVDRSFNCHHDHAMEIWKYIKDHDNGVTNFHFEVSADLITEEELELMATMRPGLIQLEIGVQSTNEITIKEIHRTMKLQKLKEVVKRVQSMGNIHQHLDLIAGLPYEDYETFQKSFDEIYALKPNQLQLGFLKVLKGSYMYDHAAEYEIVYHDRPPYEVLSTKWLSYGDVLAIKQVEEMLEVYYNSGQFEVTMKLLEKLFTSPFEMFQRMGAFYQKKGYFGMSHSRIRRCEILLEFVQENSFEKENLDEMIKEALIFDLYYRENCKSRPAWAKDMAEFKHMTRFFCRSGKLSHVEPFDYRFPSKQEWSIEKLPKRLEKPLWVLFHYDRRDPLDHQAEIEYVQEETWQQSEQKKS